MTRQGQSSPNEEHLRQLLLRGLDGDAAAYRAFLQDLSAHLRAYFRKRLTRLPDEVEDLVQEALMAIHNQRHTYDASLPLTAWVHAIAKYKLIDFLRRRAGKEALHDAFDESNEYAFFAVSDGAAAEARRDVNTLLAQLPERLRLPIIHTKLEGLSVAETACATGLSEAAVKVGVHRGLKRLAALLRGKT